MPYYWTHYDEIAPRRFMPAIGDVGTMSALDLRADPTRREGPCLVWTQERSRHPAARLLGESLDDTWQGVTVRDRYRRAIHPAPGLDGVARIYAGSEVWNSAMGTGQVPLPVWQRQLVADDFTRYPALRQKLVRWFGLGTVAACLSLYESAWMPLLLGSTLATDNFNRSGTGLGANWGTISTYTSCDTNGTQCVGGAAGGPHFGNYYSAVSFPNDQWGQATVSPVTDRIQGVLIRAATGAVTFYSGGMDFSNGGDTNQRIWKVVAGSWTNIGTNAVALATSDVVYVEAQGTSLVLKINGTPVVSQTDASIASGSVGLLTRDNTSTTTRGWDDWSGGDFLGGEATTVTWVGYIG